MSSFKTPTVLNHQEGAINNVSEFTYFSSRIGKQYIAEKSTFGSHAPILDHLTELLQIESSKEEDVDEGMKDMKILDFAIERNIHSANSAIE